MPHLTNLKAILNIFLLISVPLLSGGKSLPLNFLRELKLEDDDRLFPGKLLAATVRQLTAAVGEVGGPIVPFK